MHAGHLKQHTKQAVRRAIGEPYVGKRLKMRRLNAEMPKLGLLPRNILDAGAEDATFVYWLADRYPEANVTAVDMDAAAVAACIAARPRKYQHRVTFRVGYFADLEPRSFDLITAFDVLEHIVDDKAAVGELVRALEPGGHLLVHVPRDRWLTRSGRVHAVPDADAWRINAGHVRQGYSPERMRALLEDSGLTVLEVSAWLGRWGTLAHEFYARVETPIALRLLSLPVTDACAALDRRAGTPEGNTIYARAVKPT
ncbi:MAG: class I SAM-dependent methyltransferase [Actinomycetota bacterium]|nr:class I SAM-dependent methyltransferase [Actinomycetota bacterium]